MSRSARETGARTAEPGTPLADAMAALIDGPRIHNFHALPWPNALWRMGPALRERYDRLLVAGLTATDLPVGSVTFDSLFSDSGPVAQARSCAATAFGADATFFLTSGNSGALRTAISALPAGSVVGVDGSAHQAAHFAAAESAGTSEIVRLPTLRYGNDEVLDLDGAVRLLTTRAMEGRPVTAVVITGSPYGRLRLRMEPVLAGFGALPVVPLVICDEAWSAMGSFSVDTAVDCALPAAERLRVRGGPLPPLLVCHSAHKSMCALRQGAYLHVFGSPELTTAVQQAHYRGHTSSPSWPILLSLDLARAHAEAEGERSIGDAVRLRGVVESAIAASAGPVSLPPVYELPEHVTMNPMMTAVRVGPSPRAASTARAKLLHEHRIHVPRQRGDELLLHFHIGVDADATAALVVGLADPALTEPTGSASAGVTAPGSPIPVGTVSAHHVIAYPPGNVLAHPGELWTDAHEHLVLRARRSGADIHVL